MTPTTPTTPTMTTAQQAIGSGANQGGSARKESTNDSPNPPDQLL